MLFKSNYILSWGSFLVVLMVGYLLLTMFHLVTCSLLSFNLDFFMGSNYVFTLSWISTWQSSIFSFSVSFISLIVFMFMMFYMNSSTKLTYFIWLTFLFVLSMLILINFSDLFFVMLGWDGLGVSSFFLILFYQNSISLNSASFTLLMNRMGDALLVLAIILLSVSTPFLGFLYSSLTCNIIIMVLILGLMTKSALFPFSPWLPAAMAAPTPISSLVHSSTLVTAGLYLMLRNYSLIASMMDFMQILIVVGLFTSFYAGLNTLVEVDSKKIIALSTLSHLGFICFALGLGWLSLAFLHLLSHAFFKSSLFMSVGCFISSHHHYQDSRYFSSFSTPYPLSSVVILVSEANLLGFPFLSGFYSKDLILESFSFSSLSYFLTFVLYLNVIFTFVYSLRIFSSLVSFSKFNSMGMVSESVSYFSFAISFLSIFSIPLSYFLTSICLFPNFPVPSFVKFLPIILLMIVYSMFLTNFVIATHLSLLSSFFVGSMVFLAPFWLALMKNFMLLGYKYQRLVELGGMHFVFVSYPMKFVLVSSSYFSFLYKFSTKLSMLYTFLFLILVSLLILI